MRILFSIIFLRGCIFLIYTYIYIHNKCCRTKNENEKNINRPPVSSSSTTRTAESIKRIIHNVIIALRCLGLLQREETARSESYFALALPRHRAGTLTVRRPRRRRGTGSANNSDNNVIIILLN